MRSFRAISCALLAAFLTLGGSAHAASMRDLAPADEYFGRLKMSVLGIHNELATLERRAASGDRDVAAMAGKLAMVDDAIRDWRARYPRDTWLPRYAAERSHIAQLLGLAIVR